MSKRKKYGIASIFLGIAKIAPAKFVLQYFSTVANGVAMAFIAIATNKLFSAILAYSEGKASLPWVLEGIFFLVAITLSYELFSGISAYYGEVYYYLSTQHIQKTVNAKASRLSCMDYEKPSVLNSMQSAYDGSGSAIDLANIVMDILTLYIPYFIIYGVYLFCLWPPLLLIFPLIILPTLAGQLCKVKFSICEEQKNAPLRRKRDAYMAYIGDRNYVKETRLLGVIPYFLNELKHTCAQIRTISVAAKTKSWYVSLAVDCLNMLGYGGVVFLLIHSVYTGKIPIATFAAVFSTCGMLIDMEKELFGKQLGELAEQYGSVKQFIDFMNRPEQTDSGCEVSRIQEVRMDGVSFCYPSADQPRVPVIQDIHLSLKAGESLAVVGSNGSGKTTLTKLLLGLYPPDTGTIFYDGIAHRELNPASLRHKSTAVFQNFIKYRFPLQDNIALSEAADMGRVADALCKAQLEYSNPHFFPEGTETMLSKEFGGTDLSGGQWQKVAIARGIYHTGDLVVLDEPTSAIDPVNEYHLYQCFADMVKGRIGVLVTHRLGLAKLCTRIAFLKEGRILALGTHEQLLKTCPEYGELWEAQTERYQEADSC